MSSGAQTSPNPADLRARTRTEIVERVLPIIVDGVLGTREIAVGIAQAGWTGGRCGSRSSTRVRRSSLPRTRN